MAGRNVILKIQIDPPIMQRLSEAMRRITETFDRAVWAEARMLRNILKIVPISRDMLVVEFYNECRRRFGDYADDAFEYMIEAARRRAQTTPLTLEICLSDWRWKMRSGQTPDFPISPRGWEHRKRKTRELIARLEEWLRA